MTSTSMCSSETSHAVVTALAHAGGNKRTAAKELGGSRTTLHRRLEEYRIDAP